MAATVPGSGPGSTMSALPSRSTTVPSPLLVSSSSLTPRPASPRQSARYYTTSPGRPAAFLGSSPQTQKRYDIKSLILRSMVPQVVVHVSADTDQLAEGKGFQDGFWEMLRPYGEQVHGKVTVRDSIGASRSWEDFGVRFSKIEGSPDGHRTRRRSADFTSRETNGSVTAAPSSGAASFRSGANIGRIEELVERQLSLAESMSDAHSAGSSKHTNADAIPVYTLFLQRLLSGLSRSPHETFSHPVACIIAISSRNSTPIEALRQLYDDTSRGDSRLPQWVNNEYLRYYVLVHDEELDDISKTTKLFEQMKRHFGLHCHLLRLRSSQCVPTDDDSVPVPACEWISAAENLEQIKNEDDPHRASSSPRFLYESDVTAIKTFVRGMVTQSIVPFMEHCMVTWNDQIASRRRGISGRFISLSKKLTGFGSISRSKPGTGSGTSPGSSNTSYDALQGFYRADSAEALMRKLADYAFMLRDWKLAQSTYGLLRVDFNDDKAWKYYAGANEMSAISTLLGQQTPSTKARTEAVNQMLDTASYSYLSRCAAPYFALRCLVLGAELLKASGEASADDAARWVTRILEMNLLGPDGQALLTQQVAQCYAARRGTAGKSWAARRRKAAMWNIFAASAWLELNKFSPARQCLDEANGVYIGISQEEEVPRFDKIHAFVHGISLHLDAHSAALRTMNAMLVSEPLTESLVEAEHDELVDQRSHRKSLIGPGVSPFSGIDSSPLSPLKAFSQEQGIRDDHFE